MSRILHAYLGTFEPVGNLVPNDFGFPIGEDTTPFLRSLTLRIAGIDRSGYAKADSWGGTLQLEGRDEAGGELIDLSDSYRPGIGESVEIICNTNLLYRGQITETDEWYDLIENRSVRHISVRTSGAGHALDRRLVFGDITSRQLHSALIQILQPNGIHQEIWGFYDFQPFPGPEIEAQRFNGSTALQAVQRAVNAAGDGWTWWLDWESGRPLLHVRDISTNPVDAPWDATDDSGNVLAVESVHRSDDDYANRVYVRTQSALEPILTDSFTGTGVQKTFGFSYPPLEVLTITIDGVAATFGTISGDRETGNDGLDFYYQPVGLSNWWSHVLDHRSTFDPLTSPPTGDIVVTYRAQSGNYVRAEDTAEQATKAAVMGFGSGKYEKIVELKDIVDVAAAQEYASAILAKSQAVPTVVRYTSFRHGMRPGRAQTITLAKHGINGEYNISSVRFREVSGTYDGSEVGIEYSIEATSASKAVPYPGKLMEDIIDAVRAGSDPATALGGGNPTKSGGAIATFLFPGTNADPETPITGDDLTYRYPLLPGVGNYYVPVLAYAFVTDAPVTTAVQVDCRYIDPDGVDQGSIFASAPVSIATTTTETTVTAFSAFGLVLEHGGHLEADCDQTDAAAKRLGLAVLMEVH